MKFKVEWNETINGEVWYKAMIIDGWESQKIVDILYNPNVREVTVRGVSDDNN